MNAPFDATGRLAAPGAAPSRGRFVNSGNGPAFQPYDIGHPTHVALIAPDTAFWALIAKDQLAETLAGGALIDGYRAKADGVRPRDGGAAVRAQAVGGLCQRHRALQSQLHLLLHPGRHAPRRHRHGRGHAARRAGHGSTAYFRRHMPEGRKPQIIFHGAEPMIAKDAIFAGIDAFKDRFRFGVQTNATLLDDKAIDFLTSRGVGIGLSLDAPVAEVADRTRANWNGAGVYAKVVEAIERLKGYPAFNVICTMSTQNLDQLVPMVEFLHAREVPACMLNVIRCTLPGARTVRADDAPLAEAFIDGAGAQPRALSRNGAQAGGGELRQHPDRHPGADGAAADVRYLAVRRRAGVLRAGAERRPVPVQRVHRPAAFKGGNLFADDIDEVLARPAFTTVSGRKVEDIAPCRTCAIRHFCGSPCPAEAHEMNGGMEQTGAYLRVLRGADALRLPADRRGPARRLPVGRLGRRHRDGVRRACVRVVNCATHHPGRSEASAGMMAWQPTYSGSLIAG